MGFAALLEKRAETVALPKGLCINDLIVWKCLGQNLQH